jgi:hypothetical protein
MATRSLNVVISGDAKQLGVATKKAEGHLDNLGSKGAKVGKALALGFATAGAAAGGAFVIGLKKSVDAAVDAQKSQARLEAQLKASGASYRAHAKEIDAVIQKHSKLAGVDDEDLQDAFTNILRATGSVSKAMKDMGLVTDLMRARHIDAAKAGDILAKVHNGNVGALKRMGVAIEPVTAAQDRLRESNKKATVEQVRAAKEADKTATAQKALGELQKRVGGQAEAYGKTAAGAQERFGVAVENLQEKLGARLLPVIASVTNKVATFVGGMESGKGAGGRFATAISEGFARAKNGVQVAITAIRGWLNRNRDDINSVISAARTFAAAVRDVFQGTMLPIIRRTIKAVGDQIDGLAHVIRGVVRVISGLLSGDWEKAWDGAKEVVRGAFKVIKTAIVNNLDNIQEIVKDLGPKIVAGIGKGLLNIGKALLTGIMHGIQEAAKALPGVAGAALKGIGHAITSGISSGFGKLNPFGDGIGITPPTSALSGGNSLDGADSDLGWIASAAGRFGLHTSSGLRRGAITTSGNVSFHSSGDALDEAGSPAGMMGFFRYMKAKYGPVLRELIYGPGQVGVKDGRPFNFGPALNAQHMDHVHVAFTGGNGTGDGIGDIKSLWTRAGGSSSAQNMAAAVAMAESGGNPTITNRNSDGSIDRGLWQINSVHGALSTVDRMGNARAAIKISSNGRNWNPWTVFKTGAYKRFLGAATNADGGSGGSGGSSKRKTYKKNQTASGGGIGGYDPTVVYATENTAAENLPDPFTGMVGGASGFAQRQKSNVLTGRPLKGGGPTKGISTAEGERRANAPAGPTQWDWIDAAMAEARLTPGTEDDIRAAQWNYDARGSALDAARASGDPRAVSQAANDLASARDALLGLTEAINQANEIQRQRDELDTTIAANQAKILALANQGPQIVAAVVAAVSGGIGGQIGLGMQTPGFAGQVARY